MLYVSQCLKIVWSAHSHTQQVAAALRGCFVFFSGTKAQRIMYFRRGIYRNAHSHATKYSVRQKPACKLLAAKFCEQHLPIGMGYKQELSVLSLSHRLKLKFNLNCKGNKNNVSENMIAALTSIPTACSSSPAESNIPQIYLFLRTGDENGWQRHCCVC